MSKYYVKFLFFIVGSVSMLHAKAIVDCRVMTGHFVTECNPYGKKLHHIKELTYYKGRKKLTIEKRVPAKEQSHHLKVIDVAKMVAEEKSINVAVQSRVSPLNHRKVTKRNLSEKRESYAYYTVIRGDSFHKIAQKLNLTITQLTTLNGIKKSTILRIGQKLKVPYREKILDALSKASYRVASGDTLLSIAKMFKLSPRDIVILNHIKDATAIRKGKVLKLPLPSLLAKLEAKQRREENEGRENNFNLNAFGTRTLRVTATAYTSHGKQTDSTPFLAAWNNRLRPGMKIIAVSRDLLTQYGMRNGTKVRIGGLRGFYRVRDKMNKRYKKRIDIYMGLNLKKALRWGRRSVIIYW